MTTATARPSCFIAMPITVHDNEAKLYGDELHWQHVMELLFIPAVQKAGFDAVLPSAAGTSMIHGRIVKHLTEADLVLCDLSQHNPNVLFELGVRTSLDKPVALVKDEHLKLPFDIQGLNTHAYASHLHAWSLDEEVDALSKHIAESVAESNGSNPLWQHFGVAIAAAQPPAAADPVDAKLRVILERMEQIERSARGPGIHLATTTIPVADYDEVCLALLDEYEVRSVGPDAGSDLLSVGTMTTGLENQRERAQHYAALVARLGFPATIADYDSTQVRLAIGWDRRVWRGDSPNQ